MMIVTSENKELNRLARECRALAESLERIASGLEPTKEDLKNAPIIDRWSIVSRPAYALSGFTTNHPLLGNRSVHTSQVYAISADGLWARTWSRFYLLGRGLADEKTNH
jgi:hypothetical protein